MKNKKVFVILIILSILIGIMLALITFNMKFAYNFNINNLLPSSLRLEGYIETKNNGFPFAIWFCPSGHYVCTINPISVILNILFYSLLTLFVFYLIRKIFLSFRKIKS